MKKRLLSILLCLAMAAGVFPATAFAAAPAKTAHVFEEASKSRRPKRVAGKDKFIDSKTFIASTIDQRTAAVNDVTITGTVGHVLTKQMMRFIAQKWKSIRMYAHGSTAGEIMELWQPCRSGARTVRS